MSDDAKRKEEQEAAQRELAAAFRGTWATEHGRRAFTDLLEFSGVNRDGITAAETQAGALDPLKLAGFAGARRVGLRIAHFLDMGAAEIGAPHMKRDAPRQTAAKTGP